MSPEPSQHRRVPQLASHFRVVLRLWKSSLNNTQHEEFKVEVCDGDVVVELDDIISGYLIDDALPRTCRKMRDDKAAVCGLE
jgi:hypothetical protein